MTISSPLQQAGSDSVDGLFRQGRLDDAVERAAALVRAQPAAAAPRLLLAELMLFTGDLQRAESLVGALAALEPGTELVAAEFRQLLRAEIQRRAILETGAAPEFVAAPTASQQGALRALAALRAGDGEGARREAAEAEAARPHPAGEIALGGVRMAVDECRDMDDILCGSMEMLTTTGKCFWVPTERITEISFHAPRRLRDLFWRRASVVVRSGPEGDIYIPALYHPAGASDALRLGRATEWSHTVPVRGIGQRMFLAGEDAVGIMDLSAMAFA